MKKVYSLLALPLVAATCLFGCGKTERTVEELTTLHNDIVSTHTITGTKTSGFYEVKTSGGATTETPFFVVYDNANNLDTKAKATIATTELQQKYANLNYFYGRTMTLAYSYYHEFKDVFYNNIKDKDYEKDELSELYDKLKAFQRELEDFNTHKEDLEREVALFGIDGEVVGAKVDAFNSEYTDLIGVTLDFVNYFRDLHTKHFFPSDVAVDQAYAKRVYNDGLLTLANYLYQDYLVALEENGTTNVNVIHEDENNLYKTALNNIITKNSISANQLKEAYLVKFDSDDANTKAEAVAEVKQCETALNTFKQYYDLYKEVFNKVSMHEHNNYRFDTNGGYDSVDDYLNTLSVVDAANVRVLLDIEDDRVVAFVSALDKLNG